MLGRTIACVFLMLTIGFSMAEGATFDVSEPGNTPNVGFQWALNQAASNGEDDIINVQADMVITSTLTYSSDDGDGGHTLTINGNGHYLYGNNSVQIMNINTDSDDNGGDSGGDITIRNLVFQNGNNTNDGFCGGLYVETAAANVTIDGCTFTNNSAMGVGGGVGVWTESGAVTLTNDAFTYNITVGFGGGALVWTNSGTVILTNNTFTNNSAAIEGGGVQVTTLSGTAILTNNIFIGNSGVGVGGGAAVWTASGTTTLTNNTFTNNSAEAGGGGGVYVGLESDPAKTEIYNNIIWNNTANTGHDLYITSKKDETVSAGTVKLYNNDLGPNSNFDSGQSEDLYITDTTNYFHGSNITDDPQLVDPANGDVHLQDGSPCIDAGDNDAPALPSTDFEGDDRIINGTVDIGADEYKTSTPPTPPAVTPVPTMTEWGMILFMLLAGSVAIRQIRRAKV